MLPISFGRGVPAHKFIFRALLNARQLSTVRHAHGPISVAAFQRDAFEAGRPLVVRLATEEQESLPALAQWFASQQQRRATFTPYLDQHSHVGLPFELMLPPATAACQFGDAVHHFLDWLSRPGDTLQNSLAELLRGCLSYLPSGPASEARFLRFEAPMALLNAGLKFNEAAADNHYLERLYIAQAPLSTLPTELQRDVPTPELVKKAGKGDIYGSSIWIGLEPTYTPWHRDPNPNLFCQLWSSKVVRMLPPRRGEQLFLQARAALGQVGSPRIRGEEMMQGAERQVLFDAIWGEDVSHDTSEVTLARGDMLYIPTGWWHSVRSEGGHGTLNASVNWWFR